MIYRALSCFIVLCMDTTCSMMPILICWLSYGYGYVYVYVYGSVSMCHSCYHITLRAGSYRACRACRVVLILHHPILSYSILRWLLSSLSSGALESHADLLLSCPTMSLTHITNKHTNKHTNIYRYKYGVTRRSSSSSHDPAILYHTIRESDAYT